jgi:hypothetical protein
VEFFAGFEADGFAGGDVDLGTGTGIAPDAGFACTDAEDAEAAELYALTGGQSLLKTFENRIHRRLCFCAWESRALDYVMDDVLFNQRSNLAGATEMNVLRFLALMLQFSEI